MAVPRIDPRVTKDRIYEYGEYKVLSAQFGQKAGRGKAQVHGGGWIGTDTQSRLRQRRGISFGLLLALGAALLLVCAAYSAWLQADTLSLSYQKSDVQEAIASMDQTLDEAVSAQLAGQSKVLAASHAPGGVAYPVQTKYVVLTNIPAVSGGKLVEDLYPLSRGLVRIDP